MLVLEAGADPGRILRMPDQTWCYVATVRSSVILAGHQIACAQNLIRLCTAARCCAICVNQCHLTERSLTWTVWHHNWHVHV